MLIRQRFAHQIRFLQDRLTPGGYLGLHLTVGAAIIVLASWWFGGVAEDVITGDPLVILDQKIAVWFHEYASGTVTQIAIYITFLGSVAFLGGVSLATAVFFLWRRDVMGAMAAGLTWLAFCVTAVDTLRMRRTAIS